MRLLDQLCRLAKGLEPENWLYTSPLLYEKDSNTFSGWATVFSAFKSTGEWQGGLSKSSWPRIETPELAVGSVSAKVKLNYEGRLFHTFLFAGQFSMEREKDRIGARTNWCLVIEKR